MQSSRTDYLSTLWSRGYTRLAAKIASLINVNDEDVVVELGCGVGQLTIPLANIITGRICAVDRDQMRVAELERRIAGSELANRVNAFVWDSIDKMECGTADAVVSNFVLGWMSVEEAEGILELLGGVLKSNGRIVLSDFSPVAIKPAQRFAIEQGQPDKNENPSVRWWTPEEVVRVLYESGYSDISVSCFDWNMKLGYNLALEQLERWDAKKGYAASVDSELRLIGMELPQSFIVSGVRR